MTDHSHDFEIDDTMDDRDAPAGGAWHSAHRVLLIVGAVALVSWILSGIYAVGASENAVVERCGEYLRDPSGKVSAVGPGIYMGLPWPLDRVEKIPVRQSSQIEVNTFEGTSPEVAALKLELVGKQVMTAEVFDARYIPSLITADRNIVYAAVNVSYHIDDPDAYLSAVAETEGEDLTARQKLFTRLIEREITTIVNHTVINNLLKSRLEVERVLSQRIRDSFDTAKTGVAIDSITLSPPHVTERNKAAYDAVNTAIREREIYIADAEAFKGRRTNEARAEALKIDAAARNYRDRVLDTAHGEADRFFSFYQQAYANPEIAWFDKWTDTVRDVLKNASRVYFVRPGQKVYYRSPPPEKKLDPNEMMPPG